MKLLRIEIMNHKKVKAFSVDLNGENLALSGKTGAGKTTAISALWDIIKATSDPLTHGAEKGRIYVALQDGKRRIFAERKFTNKTNQTIVFSINGADSRKISMSDFKSWFNSLGVNPHKIMDMKPLEQTQTLLNAVLLPKGVSLEGLDKQREEAADKRKVKGQLLDIAKKSIGDEPEKVEPVDTKALIQQLNETNAYNAKIDTAKAKSLAITADIVHKVEEIESIKKEIQAMQRDLEDAETSLRELKEKKEKIADIWLKNNPKKSVSEIEDKINNAEKVNSKILLWEKWNNNKEAAKALEAEYKALDREVKKLDKMKKETVANAKWPIEGLSVENGNITYNGCLLSNCGHSEQMLICGALAAASIKEKELHVVRMDGIESMSPEDFKTLQKIFNDKDIQVLSSRVSRGDVEEGEIVIEEGKIKSEAIQKK